MIYPKFPQPGDTIGICAPSAGVGGKLTSFDLSLEALQDAGFSVKETSSVRNDVLPSAPADIRGREFNEIYSDPEVSAVICASGGDYCIESLPYIDAAAITSHPKWFCGYSDPTSIQAFITTKLDIATIYGFNAGGFDWRPLHDFQHNALSILSGDIPVQTSFDMYSSRGFDDETLSYELDAPVKWELYNPVSCPVSMFETSGRLIGGCIDVIESIIGTPYEDYKGFSDRYASDGLIWYFDNFALDPMRLYYAMRKMQLIGLFDHASAVIFGRTLLPGGHSDDEYLTQLARVFKDITFDGNSVPLIWNADIGHTKPSFTLINGSLASLSYHDGRAMLNMNLSNSHIGLF